MRSMVEGCHPLDSEWHAGLPPAILKPAGRV